MSVAGICSVSGGRVLVPASSESYETRAALRAAPAPLDAYAK